MTKQLGNLTPLLPVEKAFDDLRRALRSGHAILTAPPGSGKTTRVPLALLDEAWLKEKKILLLEPRRPAARLAAGHLARLLGQSVGDRIGYQVRFDRRISCRTRIEVVTEGVLNRRLQTDPELPGVGLVIFDEFHERSLQADLGLALCLDIYQNLRPDLRLLIMSATLDVDRLAAQLPVTVVRADGRQYPVETLYLERPCAQRQVLEQVVNLVRRALDEQARDVLVFLPGQREIRQVEQRLSCFELRCVVQRLYGDLTLAKQDEVLRPTDAARRRVILSTDLAESSVTIPGVGAVVDSGLTRKPQFDAATGLTRLETLRIARTSATQRAGRAGRSAAGRCYRAWTQAQHRQLPATSEPEILRSDLGPVALELANWGVADPTSLCWLDPPPVTPWQEAVRLLRQLGAIEEDGLITGLGRKMAAMPVHPRLAHMLLKKYRSDDRNRAIDVAALLSERDPWRPEQARRWTADIALRLQGLAIWRARGPLPSDFDRQALKRVGRVATELAQWVPNGDAGAAPVSLGAQLSLAYPDRIAQRRLGGRGRFLSTQGREVRLAEDDPLAAVDYLVAAHVDGGRAFGTVRLAAVCDATDLSALHADRISTVNEVIWDDVRQSVAARRLRRFDAIVLERAPHPLPADAPTQSILNGVLRREGVACLDWTAAADTLRQRTAIMRDLEPAANWPDMSDAWLLENLELWLDPWTTSARSLRELRRVNLASALAALLDWPAMQRLEQQLPINYRTPVGRQRRIRYRDDGPPILAVALQEMYGVSETPLLATGRVPLVLHLLSPAGRPLQITQDLAAFWARGYQDVRKEMRGRYPKHHWPEDPANAAPTIGIKRR